MLLMKPADQYRTPACKIRCVIRCVRAPFDLFPRFVPSHRSRHGSVPGTVVGRLWRFGASRPALNHGSLRVQGRELAAGGVSLAMAVGAWWWLRRPTPVVHSTGTRPGLALASGAGHAARVGKGPRHRRPRPAPSTPCRSCTQSPWSWPQRQCPVPHAAVTKTTAP